MKKEMPECASASVIGAAGRSRRIDWPGQWSLGSKCCRARRRREEQVKEQQAVNDYGACLGGGAQRWFGVGGSRTEAAEFCNYVVMAAGRVSVTVKEGSGRSLV